MTIAQKMGDFSASIQFDKLPENIREQAKLALLDTLGGILAGRNGELAEMLSQLTSGRAEGKNATLLKNGKENALLNTIIINCGIAHSAEIDDISPSTGICTGGMVVPSALAIAEALGCSGIELLEAIVSGYEISARAGLVMPGSQLLSKGYWPSAQFGPLGTAAAASRLLKLDGPGTAHAIASATTLCGGLINGGAEGPSCRHLLYGWSAACGVQSALSAAAGFTGPSEGFEEPRGLYASRGCGNFDHNAVTEELGEKFQMERVLPKAFAAAMQSQAAISALLQIMKENGLSAGDISAVDVFLPPMAMTVVQDDDKITNPSSAAGNGRYLMAAAAIDGQVLPPQFTSERISAPDVSDFMARVRIFKDSGLEKYSGWPARVELSAGCSHIVRELPGWCDYDIYSREKLICDKFFQAVAPVKTQDEAKKIFDTVMAADQAPSVCDIVQSVL